MRPSCTIPQVLCCCLFCVRRAFSTLRYDRLKPTDRRRRLPRAHRQGAISRTPCAQAPRRENESKKPQHHFGFTSIVVRCRRFAKGKSGQQPPACLCVWSSRRAQKGLVVGREGGEGGALSASNIWLVARRASKKPRPSLSSRTQAGDTKAGKKTARAPRKSGAERGRTRAVVSSAALLAAEGLGRWGSPKGGRP